MNHLPDYLAASGGQRHDGHVDFILKKRRKMERKEPLHPVSWRSQRLKTVRTERYEIVASTDATPLRFHVCVVDLESGRTISLRVFQYGTHSLEDGMAEALADVERTPK